MLNEAIEIYDHEYNIVMRAFTTLKTTHCQIRQTSVIGRSMISPMFFESKEKRGSTTFFLLSK